MNEKGGGGKKVLIIVLVVAAVLIGLPLLCCGGCVYMGYRGIKDIENNEDYLEAVELAENNAEVQAKIGTPFEANFLQGGAIDNTNGKISIRMPISGPNGTGTLVVDGSSKKVEFDDGSVVDLTK